jgi:IgGFc binding protein
MATLRGWVGAVCLVVGAAFVIASGCSASNDRRDRGSGGDGASGAQGGAGGGILNGPGSGGSGNTDIVTCEDAADAKSYIGCDFWPTVTANNVWSIFDYAVVVANASSASVDATVQRGGSNVASATIAANSLTTIYLPWVPELKGPDADEFGSAMPLSQSVMSATGAYHLTTSAPVTVYQFNALEYVGQGGPPGKDWSSCPGTFSGIGCFSFSNDASLLLPSTAMTGNYRVLTWPGWLTANIGSTLSITGTADGTAVTVHVSTTGNVVAGGGIAGAGPGGTINFTLNAGQVAELVSTPDSDLSGSLVQADKPIQVITGMPCVYIPDGFPACDHIEESVFPAETLGQHYYVTRPSGPAGDVVPHTVRIFGNVDGTSLTYPSGQPPGAPSSINAGQVVTLDQVQTDFEISGSAAFAVGSYMLGASIVDPNGGLMARGDPAQTFATAVEQYRTRYIFLAPMDYDVNYVSIIHPDGTVLTLDGSPASGQTQTIGSGFSITRVALQDGQSGAHELVSDKPVGIQVAGYGSYTSYYYPGGSDLLTIAPPPVN